MARRRRATIALVAATLTVAAMACGGDATPGASTAPACAGCRTLRVGTDARLEGTSVGVRRCSDGTCELAVAAPDGRESDRTVAPGDTVGTWRVEVVTADALVVRPA